MGRLKSLETFQSAPLTGARGDTGCCNQRNSRQLPKSMREPPFICILLSLRVPGPRDKSLSDMDLQVARKHGQIAAALPSRQLQDQRSIQVQRFLESVMLCFVSGVFIQMIDPEGILLGVDFLEQAISERRPFGFSELAFKNRHLHPDAVILAGPCHAAQPLLSRFINGGNVVCNQDEHGLTSE